MSGTGTEREPWARVAFGVTALVVTAGLVLQLVLAIFPVVWLIYTMIRGAIVEDRFGRPYYPYEFLRADLHGYAYVAIAATIVAVLFFVLSFGAVALDRRLPGIEPVTAS